MPVTLRIRLVLGLLALLTVGLVLFGLATYSFHSRSQYDRLDEQVRASQPLVSRDLDQAAGRGGDRDDGGPGRGGGRGPGGGPAPVFVPPGTYAELRDANGALVVNLPLSTTGSQPKLPTKLKWDG